MVVVDGGNDVDGMARTGQRSANNILTRGTEEPRHVMACDLTGSPQRRRPCPRGSGTATGPAPTGVIDQGRGLKVGC